MVVSKGEAIEVVQQCKYLGTVLDDRLTFDAHVNSLELIFISSTVVLMLFLLL